MSAEYLFVAAILLALLSIGLVMFSLLLPSRWHHLSLRRFRHLLIIRDHLDGIGANSNVILRLFHRIGFRSASATLREILESAGIYKHETRVIASGVYIASPWIFAIVAMIYCVITEEASSQYFIASLWGGLAGYILPRHILRYMAKLRKEKLRDETLMMIRLMQVLFEAGLSIEQSLRTLRSQSGILLPQMNVELDRVINRIENGQDRASAFEQWSAEVGVREVEDLAQMLSQLSSQGGNIQKSLTDMVLMMEERNRTELREKVGKLSGKMTVVMMLFLFPALMIFVAGPGVLSLTSALGGLQ